MTKSLSTFWYPNFETPQDHCGFTAAILLPGARKGPVVQQPGASQAIAPGTSVANGKMTDVDIDLDI